MTRGIRICVLLFSLSLWPATALKLTANPSGEAVSAGTAEFDRSMDGVLSVTASDRSIISWQDFSINAGELTQFLQPGTQASVLNRVTGGIPSSLQGSLQANGRVFLINPNGVFVGPAGRIGTAGFLASTLNVSDAEFLAGGDLNFSGASTAKVTNLGTINAASGDVFLIARQVENAGTLSAPNGTVGLAAGTEVLLRQAGEERLYVKPASGGAAGGTGVDNSGTVRAATAELQAAGGNVYALAIRNSGVVEATAVANRGGRVYLTATGGNVENTGTISATNGTSGGSVTVRAGKILQSGEIRADGQPVVTGVEGDTGETEEETTTDPDAMPETDGTEDAAVAENGGRVELLGSERVTLAAGSVTSAQAGAFGTGGEVYVRSMDYETSTVYFLEDSNISAAGGSEGGDGGFVDVSARGGIWFEGNFDLGAEEGYRGGSLLIDPTNGVIENTPAGGRSLVGTADTDWDPSSSTTGLQQLAFDELVGTPGVSLDPRAGGSFSGGRFGNDSTISLQFTGDFSVNDPFGIDTATGATGVNLLVEAANIYINEYVTGSDGGFLSFNASDKIEIDNDVSALGTYTPGTDILPPVKFPPSSSGVDPATWDPAYQIEFQALGENSVTPGTFDTGEFVIAGESVISTESGGIRINALEIDVSGGTFIDSGGELVIGGEAPVTGYDPFPGTGDLRTGNLSNISIDSATISSKGSSPNLLPAQFMDSPPVNLAILGGTVTIQSAEIINELAGGAIYIRSTVDPNEKSPPTNTLVFTSKINSRMSETNVKADGDIIFDVERNASFEMNEMDELSITSANGDIIINTQSEYRRPDIDLTLGELIISGVVNIDAPNGRRLFYVPAPGDVTYNTTAGPSVPPDSQYDTYFGEALFFSGDGIVYRTQAPTSSGSGSGGNGMTAPQTVFFGGSGGPDEEEETMMTTPFVFPRSGEVEEQEQASVDQGTQEGEEDDGNSQEKVEYSDQE